MVTSALWEVIAQVHNSLVHFVISGEPHFLFSERRDLESKISGANDPAEKGYNDWDFSFANAGTKFPVKEVLHAALFRVFFFLRGKSADRAEGRCATRARWRGRYISTG